MSYELDLVNRTHELSGYSHTQYDGVCSSETEDFMVAAATITGKDYSGPGVGKDRIVLYEFVSKNDESIRGIKELWNSTITSAYSTNFDAYACSLINIAVENITGNTFDVTLQNPQGMRKKTFPVNLEDVVRG